MAGFRVYRARVYTHIYTHIHTRSLGVPARRMLQGKARLPPPPAAGSRRARSRAGVARPGRAHRLGAVARRDGDDGGQVFDAVLLQDGAVGFRALDQAHQQPAPVLGRHVLEQRGGGVFGEDEDAGQVVLGGQAVELVQAFGAVNLLDVVGELVEHVRLHRTYLALAAVVEHDLLLVLLVLLRLGPDELDRGRPLDLLGRVCVCVCVRRMSRAQRGVSTASARDGQPCEPVSGDRTGCICVSVPLFTKGW